jgi:glycosyltransferase involved in cell wall biosynthesis
MDQAKKSSILRNANVIQQPNVHSGFASEFQDFSRDSHLKPANHFNIGVASLDSSSPLKGADLIPEILRKLKHEHASFNLLELARFPKTQNGYMQFWSDIDCLLVLSRADNSPNVIHEARIAGVPIIATNVGGIPELINTSYSFLFNFDESLIDNVCGAITEIANREKISGQKGSTQAFEGTAKDPLDALLKVYSFNS